MQIKQIKWTLMPMLRRTAFVLALPALLLAACDQSPAERAREYLETARTHYENGDLDAALIELKNAVQTDPQNADGRRLLGQVQYELGEFAGAEKEFNRALELGADTPHLKLLLAKARLGQENYAGAVAATPEEGDLSSPILRDLLVARGDALLGLGKLHEAEKQFEQVLGSEPHANAYAGLARVAFARREYDKAQRLLSEAMELSPDVSQFYAMAGSLHRALGEDAEAETSLKRALELDPQNFAAMTNLAKLRIENREFEAAKRLLDGAMKDYGHRISVVSLNGFVTLALNDYSKADDMAKMILAYDPNHVTALYISGAAALAMNELERARSHLTRYLEAAPYDTQARTLLEHVVGRLASTDDSAGDQSISRQLLSNVSFDALEAGEAQASRRTLEALAARAPDDPSLRARLSVAKSAAGDLRRAEEEFAQALELDSDADHQSEVDRANTALILSYIRQEDYRAALSAAEDFRQRRPELPTPYSLVAMVHVARGQPDRARMALEEGLGKFPDSIELLGNLSSLEARSGNTKEAIAVSKLLIERNGEHYPTLLRLARLSSSVGDQGEAKSWARRAIEANPSATQPHVILGQLLLAEEDYQAAIDVIDQMEEEASLTRGGLEIRGEAQLGQGRTDEAIATFEQLAETMPGSAGAQYLLARAYGAGDRTDQMVQAFKRALEIDPEHYRTLVAYSRYLMQEREFDEAAELVNKLEADSDGNPEVTKLSAELALLNADYPSAIQKFTEAKATFAKGGVFDQSIAVNLSSAYWEGGDQGKAVEVLQEWLAHEPGDAMMRLKLASRLESMGQDEKAAEEFLRVIALDPEHWIARNQFALLLHDQGSLDVALTQARTAVEQSGGNPLVMDTVGVILLSQGDTAGAVSILQEAKQKAPDVPEISLHLARALGAAGRAPEARETLDSFLSRSSGFPLRDEMQQLYDSLN